MHFVLHFESAYPTIDVYHILQLTYFAVDVESCYGHGLNLALLNIRSGLEQVPICEPITYQPTCR